MKNIALSLVLLILVSACSSGTSVSDIPSNVTASTYVGTYQTTNGLGSGRITLDLTDQGDGAIAGNLIVTPTIANSCLCSSEVTGTQTGFDILLETGECTVTQRPLSCDEPTEVRDTMGTVIETFCPARDFTGNAQIALTGTVNSFTGTFVVNGDVCQAPTFSSIRFSRTGSIAISR